MKRMISTALAALLLVGAPLAAFAQGTGDTGSTMEQPAKGKHKGKHKGKKGKKGKKGADKGAAEGETK